MYIFNTPPQDEAHKHNSRRINVMKTHLGKLTELFSCDGEEIDF